ncbi:alpha/beta hydrolase [Vagococcus salmoninarum]|uniref:alpha/beta hydrolase n=1 Tax=Vagococcus salmoninarum TaxID=2739 RepID=UPI0028D6BAF7|nr:alpha/beta hydrolase [Vagococcus salmoninarum]
MKKFLISILIVLVIGVVGGLGWGVNYLFNYAVVRGEKDFIGGGEASGSTEENPVAWDFAEQRLITLTQKSQDGINLQAKHIKQKQTSKAKLAIIAHGYTSQGDGMQEFGEMFYDMGYDLLVPDARAHGASEGEYMGFGWPDRLDYVQWIDEMIKDYNGDVEIILYGVSMGAATVMMTAGEELPPQVKLIIEDCGYDTVTAELTYQLKEMFNLPAFPLIPLTSIYSGIKAGYNFNEASSVAQLAKNDLPTLFIHGDADKFVPTEMVYQNYEATKGPKELYIVKGAAHAQAFSTDKGAYQKVVSDFIAKYHN